MNHLGVSLLKKEKARVRGIVKWIENKLLRD
jgi:hypothetical protein